MDGMLEQMPSRLFKEWQAYYLLEPFGQWRDDYRMCILASILANIKRDPKKHPTPFDPLDFMPDFMTLPDEDEIKSIEDKVMQLAKALGAKVVKRESK